MFAENSGAASDLGTVHDMEPMDEKHAIAAFERAIAHQKRALAALGHPASSKGNDVQSAATSEDLDASDQRAANALDSAAQQTPAPSPALAKSSGALREPALPGDVNERP
jgi:hypothetical protein